MRITFKRLGLVAGVACLVTASVGLGAAFGGGSSSTVYTACLGGGILYNVTTNGTTPTCKRGDGVVSWNQTGPQGGAGVDGNTVLNGTTPPPSDGSLGKAGDFYLDTSAYELYGPRTSNGWPATGTPLIGPKGDKGDTGSAGADGRMILHGTGVPDASVGSDGDFYLDTGAYVLYGPKAAGSWPATGVALVGPSGSAGADGRTILHGTGAPDSSVGNDGDFYLNTSTHVLYGPKTSGTWPTPGISLVGPAGPAGSSDAWQSGGDDAGIFLEGDSVFASIATVQVPAGKYHVSFTGWAQTTSSGGDVFCDFASYGGVTLATVPPYSSLTYGYGNASLAAQKTIDVSFSSSSTISFQCEGPRTVLVGGVLDALQVTTVQSQ